MSVCFRPITCFFRQNALFLRFPFLRTVLIPEAIARFHLTYSAGGTMKVFKDERNISGISSTLL